MKIQPSVVLHGVSCLGIASIVFAVLEFRALQAAFPVQRAAIPVVIKRLLAGVRPPARGIDYDHPFFRSFAEVNLGCRRPTSPPPPPPLPPGAAAATQLDLSTIVDVVAITRGVRTGTVVEYQVDIEVPAELVAASGNAPLSSIPPGRRRGLGLGSGSRGGGAVPPPPHHLSIGDPLWKPYDHVSLHSIPDARTVVFEVREPDGSKRIQKVIQGEHVLPGEVQRELNTTRPDAVGEARSGDQSRSEVTRWKDTLQPHVDKSGRVHLSRNDVEDLRRRGAEILGNGIQVRDYVARRGGQKLRGIQIRKVDARLKRYGLRAGDVVLAVNNHPVKGVAHARGVARSLHRRGVREFALDLLRRGEPQRLRLRLPPD